MTRRPHRSLLLALLALSLGLAGCTDQAVIDRIARLEQTDEELRDSLTDLGAPDPEAQRSREAVLAELEAVAARITAVETDIEALRATTDAQSLEVDDRLTTTELQLEEARAQLQQLRTDLDTLVSRVNSLETQFDDHRSNPFGHGE